MTNQDKLPDTVSHFYKIGLRPFMSVSALDDEAFKKAMDEVNERVKQGLTKASFRTYDYITARRKVEHLLRVRFLKKGGIAPRLHPHYFWWTNVDVPKQFGESDNIKITLQLDELPKQFISFTYPDSMGSLRNVENKTYSKYYHGNVFTYDEIMEFFSNEDFPTGGWERFDDVAFAKFIEMQLWSDEPILDYLKDT